MNGPMDQMGEVSGRLCAGKGLGSADNTAAAQNNTAAAIAVRGLRRLNQARAKTSSEAVFGVGGVVGKVPGPANRGGVSGGVGAAGSSGGTAGNRGGGGGGGGGRGAGISSSDDDSDDSVGLSPRWNGGTRRQSAGSYSESDSPGQGRPLVPPPPPPPGGTVIKPPAFTRSTLFQDLSRSVGSGRTDHTCYITCCRSSQIGGGAFFKVESVYESDELGDPCCRFDSPLRGVPSTSRWIIRGKSVTR